MKLRNIPIISGIIISISGIIFHLQGNAVIGPESSFMYSNPEWIIHGIEIVIIGIIICGISIGINTIKKN
jgi:hypothetical protein